MKDTIDTLRAKAGSTYVRAVVATGMLVPIAMIAGGFSTSPGGRMNHNETLLGIRQGKYVNHNETLLGIRPGRFINHNETLLSAARS